MTKYEQICEAFRDGLPRKRALHKAIEELPMHIRNALSAELDAPQERAEFLSSMYHRDVPYVYLARPAYDQPGKRTWEPCFDSDVFFCDSDGVLLFGLGLFIQAPDSAPYMLHSTIAIEDVAEDTFKLVIVNAPGSINVNIGDPSSYTAAAQRICEWMLALQTDPRTVLGEKAQIGFGRSR